MRRAIVILGIILSLVLPNAAWSSGMLLWQQRLDFGGRDITGPVVADPDRVYVAGRVQAVGLSLDWFVGAFDVRTGNIVWTDRYDAGGGFDAAFVNALDDGRLFVGGESELAGNADWLVRAYDAVTGNLLWQDRFRLPGGGEAFVNSIKADGGLVVAIGGGLSSYGNEDIIWRAYDAATGTLRWAFTGGGPGGGGFGGGDDEGSDVRIVDGRVYVAAILATDGSCALSFQTPNYSGHCDFAVGELDALTGAFIWGDLVDGGDFDAALSLSVLGGRLIAVGTVSGGVCQADLGVIDGGTGGNCDFYVKAYDVQSGTGIPIWSDQYNRTPGGYDLALGVALDNRRAFVSGTTAADGTCTNPYVVGGNCDFTVRAYDLDSGDLLWKDEFDLAGGVDIASGIRVEGGRLVVAGRGQNNSVVANANSQYQDFLVRAYNASTGALRWQDQYDLANGFDRASGTAAELSRVFVGARATNSDGNLDFIVRAYRW